MNRTSNAEILVISMILLSAAVVVISVMPFGFAASPPHRFKGYATDTGLHPVKTGTTIRAMLVNVGGATENYTTTVNNSLSGKNYDFNVLDLNDDNNGRPIFFYIGTDNTTQTVTFVTGGMNIGYSQFYNLTIVDRPRITDNSPTTSTTGDSFTFNVTATDYVDIPSKLRVNVSWSHGSLSYNKTLSPVGGNYFIGINTTNPNSIDDLSYTIWVNDTSGNMNHSGPHLVDISDNDPPTSSVTSISGYWKATSPQTISYTSHDNAIGVKNTTLFYRYRATNASTWDGWVTWSNASNPDVIPWAGHWHFNFPNASGHYQFYSKAKDNVTNTESKVASAEAFCGYDAVAPTVTMTALSTYKKANFLVQWAKGVEATSGIARWTVQRKENISGTWTAWLTNVSYTVRSATWLIANTTEGTTVFFRALAVDNATNCGTWSANVSTTKDAIAPVISFISSGTPSTTSATITWTTNENANGNVTYGTTTAYGSWSEYSSYVTAHEVPLTGLSSITVYHYKVISIDPAGNQVNSTDYTFTTASSGGDGGVGGDGLTPTPIAEAGGPYSGYINETIAFSGSRSSETGGSITGYRWDWTNDGTYETNWSASATATHAYTTVGTYIVKLRVKDGSDITDSDTALVNITARPGITTSQHVLDLILAEYNVHLVELFYANDTNGDGILDDFTDPNDSLTEVHFASINGTVIILLSIDGDTIPEFFWDPTIDTITFIHYSAGNIIVMVNDTLLKTKTVTISIEKDGWTYIEAIDIYPDNLDLIVRTADGRAISSDMIWRENGKVYIFDDPAAQYVFIYSFAGKGPLFDVTVELTKDTVTAAEGTTALITLVNVGEPGTVVGVVNFTLSKNGQVIIWLPEESVSVLGQISFNKAIVTKDLEPGTYTYTVVYRYGVNQTASSQKSFTVTSPTSGFPWFWVIAILGIIIIVGFILAVAWKKGYLYWERGVDKEQIKEGGK